MEKGWKWLVRAAICLFVSLAAFRGTAALLERKDSLEKYTPFYKQDADFDVLLIGSSHMINGVFPMELWADYGIVSYNLGGHANYPATSYWVLRNALQYTDPKMVVLDVFGAAAQLKASEDLSYLHLSTDSMPFSPVKVEMLRDILPEYGNIEDFLFDFTLYHNRWNELTVRDVKPQITREKGAESRIHVGTPIKSGKVDPSEQFKEESVGKEYIEKIITCCQERGIGILLVSLPFPATEEKQRNANSIYPIAEKYGVTYINYLYQDGIVDYETDVYDSDAHLNPSGARKVTKDLGRILADEYRMPDHRQDAVYADWWTDYNAYVDFKIEKLKEQDLAEYLMLLSDDDFDSYLYLPEEFSFDEEARYGRLIQNMTWQEMPDMMREQVCGKGHIILAAAVVDKRTGETVDLAAFTDDGTRLPD